MGGKAAYQNIINCENQMISFCSLAVSQRLPTEKCKKILMKNRYDSRRDEPEVSHMSRGTGWYCYNLSPLAMRQEDLTVDVNVTLLT